MVWPELATSSWASSSTCASTSSAKRRSSRPRSAGATARQAGRAAAARSIAASVCSSEVSSTVVTISSVAGLTISWTAVTAASSQALETPHSLPVGDRGVVGSELHAGGVRVVVDHIVAERRPGRCAGLEQIAGVAQRGGHAGLVGGVGVAREGLLERQLLLDAVQPGGDARGPRQVR